MIASDMPAGVYERQGSLCTEDLSLLRSKQQSRTMGTDTYSSANVCIHYTASILYATGISNLLLGPHKARWSPWTHVLADCNRAQAKLVG